MIALEFNINNILSNAKEKFVNFIQSNFIDKKLSLFDECFEKIGKIIVFACDEIDSSKIFITDIVTSFKNLVEIIYKIRFKIVSL